MWLQFQKTLFTKKQKAAVLTTQACHRGSWISWFLGYRGPPRAGARPLAFHSSRSRLLHRRVRLLPLSCSLLVFFSRMLSWALLASSVRTLTSALTNSYYTVTLRKRYISFFFLIVRFSFLKNLFYLFYFWLHWIFIAARRLSLVVRAGATLCCGAWASHCSGFSCCGARALGTRASVVVAHGL